MSNGGSLVYDGRLSYTDNEGKASDAMFYLGKADKCEMHREADCRLVDKKIRVREANCTLNKKDDIKDASNRMIKGKNNQYISCTLVKSEKMEFTTMDKLRRKESKLKADYECESRINSDIKKQIISENKSLIYNSIIAIVCSSLYILFFVATGGDYSAQISIILTIALIAALLNLAGTVILFMIDCDFVITKRIARSFGIEPLVLQKIESDRRILVLQSRISKVKIRKRVERRKN